MTNPVVVRLTLQNLSTKPRVFSLEPYGDYCEVEPQATVHATWELPPTGDLELEIALVDDGVLIWDASTPMVGLRPSREQPGGDLWQ